jgi:hypothetical protein
MHVRSAAESDRGLGNYFLDEQEWKNIRAGMERLFPLQDGAGFDDLLAVLDRVSGDRR